MPELCFPLYAARGELRIGFGDPGKLDVDDANEESNGDPEGGIV